jgi:adenylate kinase family enzyme
MTKVAVIGCPGSGKSTFTAKLAHRTGLPAVYLDEIFSR